MHAIAWTGHRPIDLRGANFQMFAEALDLLGVGERKDIHFITGGALGTDQWAAIYAMQRGIPHTLITPFPVEVMGRLWTPVQRNTLEKIVATAESHLVLADRYDVREYQRRNEAMVDRADVVFAVYTGKKGGGTYNCIEYARKVGREMWNLWPLDGKLHRLR